MDLRRRAAIGGAVTVSALLAVGAPLLAHGGKKDPPGAHKGPVHGKPVKDPQYGPGKGKGKQFKPTRSTFFANLLGKNELDQKTLRRRAGDPDGQGGATIVTTDTQLCFGVAVRGIQTPIALHVHKGRRNQNGPIVVPLTPIPTTGDPGASAGCVTVASDLLANITKHPHRYYVNIHTGDFPNGALRGQLHRAPRF
jgi:hypothetical protein